MVDQAASADAAGGAVAAPAAGSTGCCRHGFGNGRARCRVAHPGAGRSGEAADESCLPAARPACTAAEHRPRRSAGSLPDSPPASPTGPRPAGQGARAARGRRAARSRREDAWGRREAVRGRWVDVQGPAAGAAGWAPARRPAARNRFLRGRSSRDFSAIRHRGRSLLVSSGSCGFRPPSSINYIASCAAEAATPVRREYAANTSGRARTPLKGPVTSSSSARHPGVPRAHPQLATRHRYPTNADRAGQATSYLKISCKTFNCVYRCLSHCCRDPRKESSRQKLVTWTSSPRWYALIRRRGLREGVE